MNNCFSLYQTSEIAGPKISKVIVFGHRKILFKLQFPKDKQFTGVTKAGKFSGRQTILQLVSSLFTDEWILLACVAKVTWI